MSNRNTCIVKQRPFDSARRFLLERFAGGYFPFAEVGAGHFFVLPPVVRNLNCEEGLVTLVGVLRLSFSKKSFEHLLCVAGKNYQNFNKTCIQLYRYLISGDSGQVPCLDIYF